MTTSTVTVARVSRVSLLLRAQALPVIAATIALLIVAVIIAPRTFTPASINAIVIPAGILAIAAIGQTLVVQQKGIDLSVGGMMTLSAIVIGVVNGIGAPLPVALLVAALVAVTGGIINSLLVLRLHITPLLATLASNSVFIGMVWTLSGGAAQASPDGLIAAATGSLFGIPLIGWWAVGLVILVAVFMSRSVIGRRFTGVGAGRDAANAASVVTWRHIAGAYIAAALFAALAGALLAGYAGQQTYNLAVSYQLPVIAAVVVGGASLAGGRGSVVATASAALLLTLVVQMLLTLGAPTSTQLLVQSLVLGLAAAIRLIPWRRFLRRRAGLIPEPATLTTSIAAVDLKDDSAKGSS
jgi:ribose transport system permease protein